MNYKEFPQQANQPSPHLMAYQDNNEIDLVELFRTLWKQKAKIALITAATTLGAGIYAFTAEEVWTSKAVITAPKASDMGEFYQRAQNLERNSPMVMTPDGVQIKIEDAKQLQPSNLRNSLFDDLRRELESENGKRQFAVTTDYYQNKIKGKPEREQKLILQNIVENNINYSVADEKKIKFDTISFSANSPQQAQLLLQQYLEYLNNKVIKNNESELKLLLNKFHQDLSAEANSIRNSAEDQLKLKINAVTFGLAQAKDMNMSEPAANLPAEITDATMYLLGSKALMTKLALLQVSEPVLPSRYFEIQQQLKALNTINITSTNGKSFTYVDEPSEPVTKDKPKKALILMLGIILGFMLGFMYVFCVAIINKKQNSDCSHNG